MILNKVDLVTSTHIEVIREWIGAHLNRIRIVEAVHCDVPLEILLAVGRFDPENAVASHDDLADTEHEHLHDSMAAAGMFDTWSYESDRPVSLKSLREMVRRELPASIYRCKGIVYAADSPDMRLTLQAVGRRTEIHELGEWGERTPRTQIVAIGTTGGIDAEALVEKFDSCISENGN